VHRQRHRSVTINDCFYFCTQGCFRGRARVEIERLLRIRQTPAARTCSYILRPRRRWNTVFSNCRLRPRRKRRDRDHLRTLRRVAEEPGLVNTRRRNRRRRIGGFLVKDSASLQGFQSRRGSLRQGKRVETGPQRRRVHAPSAAGATPLVVLIPSLAMDALHISQFFKAVLPTAATIGFLTVPLEY